MLDQAVQAASTGKMASVIGSASQGSGAGAGAKAPAPARTNSYATLKALAHEAGFFQPQGWYYAIKLTYTLAMFASSVALFVFLTGWLRVFVVAPYLGFVCAQMGFLSHDLGHKQVFPSTRVNNWLGMVTANLLTGMSLGWWNDKHNAHHASPNVDGLDPDIDIPFMAFSTDQAARKKGFGRLLTKYQAFLFFPALTLTVYSMQIASTTYTLRKQYKWRFPDTAMFWAHILLYYVGLPLLLGPWQALAFILIHRGTLGLLIGGVFAPNHKGMLVLDKDDRSLDFLRKQVLTSRSVRSTPLIDFLYGGLNHQAVHHLFPTMPRNKLRDAEDMVRRFCEGQQVTYHVTGVRQSFREILQSLHDAAAPLRRGALTSD